MHLVSDVLETVYVLFNYSHFIKRAKLLLLTYLLLTSLIVQPCAAAFAEQGAATANRQQAERESGEQTAESTAEHQITENPEVTKSQEILRKIASRRCHEIFVNLVRKHKPTNDRGMPPLPKTLIGTCPKNKNPDSSDPETDWGGYLKTLAEQSSEGRNYKPPKPFCGLPGYSVLDGNQNAKDNNSSYPYSIFLTEGNPYLAPQSEITDSKQMSIRQTCDYLFRPNETSDSYASSSYNDSNATLLNLLSNLRLPFCGYYNILLEETSVYSREVYSKCMAPMDLLITLKDILGHSYGNRETMISEDNCESVLTYLLERDYDASTRFYAHFVPSLARYDCRVLADYSVDAGCFSCAVAYRQWICGTSVRPPEELLDPDSVSATSSRQNPPQPPPSSDYNSPPLSLPLQTSKSDDQNFGNPIFISHSAGPKIDEDDDSDFNDGRNPSRTKTSAETSNGAKTSSSSYSSQPSRDFPDVDDGTWSREGGGGGGRSRVMKLEKPCYELCVNVELHCPFLNPSLASGGRPVFECPALFGHRDLDSYSTDKTVCQNPYQNSTLDIFLQSTNKNKQNKQKTDRNRRDSKLSHNSKSDAKLRHKNIRDLSTNNFALSTKNSAFILTSLDFVKELLRNLVLAVFPEFVHETFYLHSVSGLYWENWSAYNNCLSNQQNAVGYFASFCLPTTPKLTKSPYKLREQLPPNCCQFMNEQLTGSVSIQRTNLITTGCYQRLKKGEFVGSKLKLLNYLSTFIHMVLYACVTTWFLSISPFSR